MDARESRLMLIISACPFAFLAGVIGLAVASDQVRDRVDRRVAREVDWRVDQRVCQLFPDTCPPPPPAPSFPGGD